MAKIKINGYEFEYFEEGQGKPLVLVHGSASDYRTWDKQLNDFKKRFRVITYSRRYHWPNSEIPEGTEYSMKQQVDDLEQLLLSLEATPAHLVGHSYGGFLSLLLAMRRPDYVRSLVLGEPPVLTLFVSNDPRPAEILKLLFTKPAIALSIMKFGARGIEPAKKAFKQNNIQEGMQVFGEAIMGKEGYAKIPEERIQQTFDNQKASIAELLGPGFLPLDDKQIREIETPALLVTGQNSISMFEYFAGHLNKLMPNSELTQIPDAGHLMQEDNPGVFNDVVLRFFIKNHNT